MPLGDELAADHGDRPLAVPVDEDGRAPLRLLGRGRVHGDPERLELRARPAAGVVAPERRVQRRAAREPCQLGGRDGAAAARLLPDLLDVHDPARPRQGLDAEERAPLHVADDREPHGRSLTGGRPPPFHR